MTGIELWAGAECTVNRVGDRWFDQILRTGHHDRLEDLDRLAELGVTRVRLPVLWERVAPRGLPQADWRWTDTRLERLLRHGIAPIVGLVHHGSGPRDTDIADPRFVDGLAAFAEAVARRYPFVQDFTPVNEPLTTARFSGLYGHWYPHARDIGVCMRALAIQVSATAAAMERIRSVTPHARLVQTEELGRVSSTPALEHQRTYEEHRRWLSLDLLCGRVDTQHIMRRHLEENGVGAAQLDALVQRPCVPDLVGINYYVTSDRYLDENLERWPPCTHGGNGRERYADVEAVRVREVGIAGHRAVLDDVWRRYAIPVAIAEVHLGCTREEQLRWVAEAWRAAVDARRSGVDVRAVTLWSAFGAVDWHCLCVREEGSYEPGLFDVRAPAPRRTALVSLAQTLARGREPAHPLLDGAGWWRRPQRWGGRVAPSARARPLWIAGSCALVDRVLERCARRNIACVRWPDRAHGSSSLPPWGAVIVHAQRGADPAHDEVALDWHRPLLETCAKERLPVLAFSSDVVFESTGTRPWLESDPARATTPRGERQRRVERWIRGAMPWALVVRTGVCIDPEAAEDPLARILDALAAGLTVEMPDDELVAASVVPHVVDAALDLFVDGEQGIWHGAHEGVVSLLELCRRVADEARVPTHRLVPGRAARAWELERGVGMRAIASERAWPMPDLSAALRSYAAAWAHTK